MALSREFSKADGASPSALDLTAAFRDTGEAVSRVSKNARVFDREAAFRAGEYRDSGDETVLAGYVGHSAAMAALTINAEATKEEKKRAEDAAFEATIRALQEQIRVLEVQIEGLEEDILALKTKIDVLEERKEALNEILLLVESNKLDPTNSDHQRLLHKAGIPDEKWGTLALEDIEAQLRKIEQEKGSAHNELNDKEKDRDEAVERLRRAEDELSQKVEARTDVVSDHEGHQRKVEQESIGAQMLAVSELQSRFIEGAHGRVLKTTEKAEVATQDLQNNLFGDMKPLGS